jgi:hypothetical protein
MTKAVVLLLLPCAAIAAISCGSKPQSASSKLFGPAGRPGAANPANDYSKPYLTDEKVTKFIDSMKEEHNPFEVIFKEGGQMRSVFDVASKMEEFNASARKYGFQDYQDYTAVWGRITAGRLQLWAADMQKEMAASLQKSVSDAQKELQKPNLSPDMRKMYEEQVASTQKAVDEMNNPKSGSQLNAADLELVKKYKTQIDEAEKKYKPANSK